MALIKSRPIRVVLYWQFGTTMVAALVAAFWAGKAAGISAALGGSINVVANLAYGLIVSRVGVTTAGRVLQMAFRAEAVKIVSIIVLLVVVLRTYSDIVIAPFFITFVITVMAFVIGLLARD
jgi:ATP synthase protein I